MKNRKYLFGSQGSVRENLSQNFLVTLNLLAYFGKKLIFFLLFFQKGSLASELERRSKNSDYLSPLEILHMFLQICEAVKVFHEAKPEALAHRDLKTANILLGDGMTPIIMDLGKNFDFIQFYEYSQFTNHNNSIKKKEIWIVEKILICKCQ